MKSEGVLVDLQSMWLVIAAVVVLLAIGAVAWVYGATPAPDGYLSSDREADLKVRRSMITCHPLIEPAAS